MDKFIKTTLEDNKEKGFIQRILFPEKFPVLNNPDGTVSSHSMAWAEVDGKYVVFPTVLYNGEAGLKRYTPDKALPLVLKSGNYIEFDTPEKADYFSKEYKQAWEGKK
jgi:hypothetical protein